MTAVFLCDGLINVFVSAEREITAIMISTGILWTAS